MRAKAGSGQICFGDKPIMSEAEGESNQEKKEKDEHVQAKSLWRCFQAPDLEIVLAVSCHLPSSKEVAPILVTARP